MPAKAASARKKNKHIVTTLREVAEHFDTPYTTIKGWRAEDPPMPGEPGRFDLKEIFIWYRSNKANASVTDRKKDIDLRVSDLKLRREEFDFQKEQDLFVSKVEVDRWFSNAIIEMRETIMSLPSAIGASAPPDVRSFATSEADRVCRDVLTMLRRRLEANVSTAESTIAD